ncbi:unnamed protein product, partial [Psylliodes chrysocephalus]
MLFTCSLTFIILITVTFWLIAFLTWHIWSLGYWKRKGLHGPRPTLIFGNATELLKGRKTLGQIFSNFYKEYKAKGHRHIGAYFFGSPYYIAIDLEIAKAILQTDFQHFHSHGTYLAERADPLTANIFNVHGDRWRDIRGKLSPAFTPGKIKTLFNLMLQCAGNLREELEIFSNDNRPFDIRDYAGRFTIDIISSTAFGLETSSLKNPKSKFRQYGDKVFKATVSVVLRNTPPMVIPHRYLRAINYSILRTDVIDFFLNTTLSNIKYREQNNIKRKDFLNILLDLKNNESDLNKKLTANGIAAECFLFFMAGYETSAATISFATYELAINSELQDKTREEINKVLRKYNNEITYEALMEMEHLERVIYETLRKYPPLPFLFRECTENYKVPGEDLQIEKGTFTTIPILGIHYDPEYYPDPERFDPERFSEENRRSIPPFAWLPFGEGPRICLGMRFGLIETKLGLVTLIRNYKFSLNKNTIYPVEFDIKGLIAKSKGEMWLDLQK